MLELISGDIEVEEPTGSVDDGETKEKKRSPLLCLQNIKKGRSSLRDAILAHSCPAEDRDIVLSYSEVLYPACGIAVVALDTLP
jgi:hypothetical protein